MDFASNFVNVLLYTLWIFVFVAFIMVIVRILMDIFRDSTLGGGGKTLWVLFVIILPILGALIYLIARGKGMAERQMKEAHDMQVAHAEYTRSLVSDMSGPAADIKAAQALLDGGTINEAEFAQLKAKALA